jgi:hypothetical protein
MDFWLIVGMLMMLAGIAIVASARRRQRSDAAIAGQTGLR